MKFVVISSFVLLFTFSSLAEARGYYVPDWGRSYPKGLGQARTLPVGTMVTYEFCMANPYECRANAYVVKAREVVEYVDRVRKAVKQADDRGNITININNIVGDNNNKEKTK